MDMGADRGIKRKNKKNQDYVNFRPFKTPEELAQRGSLFVVADGVGGAAAGDVASEMAFEHLAEFYYAKHKRTVKTALSRGIQNAGNSIYNHARSQGERMATTVVAAAVIDQTLFVANVGDSRAYLWRAGKIVQITTDHNRVGELLEDNEITEEEALASNLKNKLTRSVGGELDVRVDVFTRQIQEGDRIFLCSDGITRYMTKEQMRQLLGVKDGGSIVQRAIAYAHKRGAADNISALIIQVGKKSASPKVLPLKPKSSADVDDTWIGEGDPPQDRKPRTALWPRLRPVLIGVVTAALVVVGFLNREKITEFFNVEREETNFAAAMSSLTPEVFPAGGNEQTDDEGLTEGEEDRSTATPINDAINDDSEDDELTETEQDSELTTVTTEPTVTKQQASFACFQPEEGASLGITLSPYAEIYPFDEAKTYPRYQLSEANVMFYTGLDSIAGTSPSFIIGPDDYILIEGASEEQCISGIWIEKPQSE
jgi:serine/threonine protein phosphatase PrpC